MTDQRTGFFLVAAGLCLLLAPIAGRYAWVSATVAAVYLLLAGATWLDARSHERAPRPPARRRPN